MSVPDPVTRKEMYLNKAATGSGSIPAAPVTREEMYLAEIANGGGSGGGGLVVTIDENTGVFDKTYGEIEAAFASGKPVVLVGAYTNSYIAVSQISIIQDESDYCGWVYGLNIDLNSVAPVCGNTQMLGSEEAVRADYPILLDLSGK